MQRERLNLFKTLGVQHPIIQAPMAGGGDTPELVASVSNAGALGFYGAAYSSPDQILETGKKIRSLTAKPFGVNLFAPLPAPASDLDHSLALKQLVPYYEELGIPVPEAPSLASYAFHEQLEAALNIGASAFSFTFNLLPQDAVEQIKRKGLYLLGTATTVDEALALIDNGVDAIIAQGAEAGGHRGSFLRNPTESLVGTVSLVPQIADSVSVPVVASGGVMDGRGIAASLALGAIGVQMGTAFLTCPESGISSAYKRALLHAHEDQTVMTRAFSGRWARGIGNRFTTQMQDQAILPFPIQNALTRPMRAAAAAQDKSDLLSLWAGQGIRMAAQEHAKDLVARLVRETDQAINRLKP